MKKLSLLILVTVVFLLTLSTSLFARTPDTYFWNVTQPGYFAWESSNAWTPTDLANTGIWPAISGDIANLFPAASQTQTYGKFQIAFTENLLLADIYGGITNDGFYFGSSGSPFLVFDGASKGVSHIVITNERPVLADGSLNNLAIVFFDDAKIILSNDLVYGCVTAQNPSNATGYSDFDFYDANIFFGNGHDITFDGFGWSSLGWNGDAVEFKDVNNFINNGGLLRVWTDTTLDISNLYIKSVRDCNNYLNRGTIGFAGDYFDLELALTNAYMESWYSNWLKREIAGTMTIRDFALMNLPDTTGDTDLIWTNVISANVKGDGVLFKGYSNEESGYAEFTGAISPGENGNGYLQFYSPMGDRVEFGLPTDRLDLNMDINGMRNYIGSGNDTISAENISAIDLGNIDLNINNTGISNPYRTNELMYSFDNAFLGAFNTVNWGDSNRIGEVIITPESVRVTGIPPLSNSFDVYADRVTLVKGETQQMLIARSPFEMDVNAVADESWITVQPVISLSNDALVSVPVTVPADQPTTNGFGLSIGTITFSSAADPSIYIEEDVYVLEPGYFELNKSKLWLMAYDDDSASVQAYSPLTVGVQATIEDGSSWISFNGDSSVYLTNNGRYVYFDTTAQPAGTTGLVSFVNVDTPTVRHDVAVEVVGPGFFEVAPTAIEFVTGQTQKYINVSAPFVTGVNISSADPWIAVPSSVSLDGNGYSIPVVIPVDQAAGTGTISFVSTCSTNYSFDVSVIVTSPCGDFNINTNLVEFVTGIDTQKTVTVSSESCATVNISPVSGTGWISVTNSIYLMNNTTDVVITIPIDQPADSTGMVRFTSVEDPSVSYDVDIIVVPEPFIFFSLLIAIGALVFHRAK